MKTALQTRAQILDVSPRTMAARAKRTLKSVRKQLEPVAAQYADVDNSIVEAHRDLMHAFDTFEKRLNESIEWLNEKVEE